MLHRLIGIAALALALSVTTAAAQEPLKIGLVQSLTGPFNTVGKAAVNGARLYIQQHGDTVAGRRIQLIIKDDGTSPETAKRLAQELIVNDKVEIIGAGITPTALTIAPLVTEAKIPTVVMVSGASITMMSFPLGSRPCTSHPASDVMEAETSSRCSGRACTMMLAISPSGGAMTRSGSRMRPVMSSVEPLPRSRWNILRGNSGVRFSNSTLLFEASGGSPLM